MSWKALVICPDPSLRDPLRLALADVQGAILTECPEPAEALQTVRQYGCNVCLVEAGSRPEQAPALIRALAAAGLPVIVVQAHEDASAMLRCLRHGAGDFLIPPLSPNPSAPRSTAPGPAAPATPAPAAASSASCPARAPAAALPWRSTLPSASLRPPTPAPCWSISISSPAASAFTSGSNPPSPPWTRSVSGRSQTRTCGTGWSPRCAAWTCCLPRRSRSSWSRTNAGCRRWRTSGGSATPRC